MEDKPENEAQERTEKEMRLDLLNRMISSPEDWKIKGKSIDSFKLQELEEEQEAVIKWLNEHPLTVTWNSIHIKRKVIYVSEDGYELKKYKDQWYLYNGAECVAKQSETNADGLPIKFTAIKCNSDTGGRVVTAIIPIVHDAEELVKPETKKNIPPRCSKVDEGKLQNIPNEDEMLLLGEIWDKSMNCFRRVYPHELAELQRRQQELREKITKTKGPEQTPQPEKKQSLLERLRKEKKNAS